MKTLSPPNHNEHGWLRLDIAAMLSGFFIGAVLGMLILLLWLGIYLF